MLQSKRRSWKILLVALVAAVSFSVFAGCSKNNNTGNGSGGNSSESAANGAADNTVVATYDGGEITAAQFDLEQRIMLLLSPELQQYMQVDDFRQGLIKQEIAYSYLAAHADDKAKEAAAKQADSQLSQMKSQLGDEQFQAMLDSQKVTEQQFKDYMVRVMTVVQSETAKATDDEVKAQFDKTKDDFTVASVRHILIGFTDPEGKERSKDEALKLAQDVKAKLDGGADFAALAKQYSEDPGSKDNGGLYENTEVSNWVDEFKNAALTLPLNKISDPVETSYGYHVMRVEARTPKTFDQLTSEQIDTLKSSVGSQKLDDFMSGDLVNKVIKNISLPKVENSDSSNASGNGANSGANAPAGSAPESSAVPEASASASTNK